MKAPLRVSRRQPPGRRKKARSSVGEHYLDTVGVSSSILLAPTIRFPDMRGIRSAGA